MTKNFDEQRNLRPRKTVAERTFTIGGVELVMLESARPEALTPYESITKDSPLSNDLAAMDEIILNLLEPESGEAWLRLRARNDDPLVAQDITDVMAYLVEQLSGRPTGQPSDSGPGANGTETSSTGGSSSQAIPEASTV